MPCHADTAAPVSRLQIARYACAVGDFNPVHVDEDFAVARGLPSVIAHGPLTAAIVLDMITAQIGADALRSFEVRLSAPVFPGDELTLEPDGAGGVVRKADGSVAAKVTFQVSG
jgi:acyl dehydratase